MKSTLGVLCILSLFLVAGAAAAEEVAGLTLHVERLDPATVRVWLGDATSSTAVTAFATAKGIVVVDTMGIPRADRRLRKVIARELGRDDFAILINTHEHADHTGGNAAYADCTIVAHALCGAGIKANDAHRKRSCEWLAGRRAEVRQELETKEYPAATKKLEEELVVNRLRLEALKDKTLPAFPRRTFIDRMTLDMGDTTFELYYSGGMHTASDIAIFVPERGLLLTGDTMADVWLNDTPGCLAAFAVRSGVRHDFPLLLENWATLLARKDQIRDIIPGHWNGDVSVAGFEARYEYVKALWEGIQAAAAQGRGLDDVLAEYRLQTRFPALVGSPGFDERLNAMSVTELWAVVTKQESAAAKLYELIDQRAGEDALRQVLAERDAKQPKYYFLEGEINAQGYRFLQADRTAQAITLFELNVELFPEAWNVYDSLGEALLKSGDTAGATAMYEKSLALNPESRSGKDALAKLHGAPAGGQARRSGAAGSAPGA
jgi:glyoxylase-like metal-dependent hydrolase (beta-lactamase superfamily II)